MSKDKVINSIDKSILNRTNELGVRRVAQVSSSLHRLVAEVIHGEFGESCSEFSVINCSMSRDLKYLDILIRFYTIQHKKDQEIFLKNLNYEDLGNYQRSCSRFFKISLKYIIAKRISENMRLRVMPKIRFKIADELSIYIG